MSGPLFYVGLHHPSDAHRFKRACISIRTLTTRRKPLNCAEVLLDSGAFTELKLHGRYRSSVAEYAPQIRRLHNAVRMVAAVSQDYMCEPFMLAKTGLTVEDHQRLTIERYDALVAENLPVPIMPVLQGYKPAEYLAHLRQYGERLKLGMWVGVGSVCKRNGSPEQIVAVLQAIKRVRPDLRLHGFGVKQTALLHPGVRELLYSADSMAWSYAARRAKRNPNDWREAERFTATIEKIVNIGPQPWQPSLPFDVAGRAHGACGTARPAFPAACRRLNSDSARAPVRVAVRNPVVRATAFAAERIRFLPVAVLGRVNSMACGLLTWAESSAGRLKAPPARSAGVKSDCGALAPWSSRDMASGVDRTRWIRLRGHLARTECGQGSRYQARPRHQSIHQPDDDIADRLPHIAHVRTSPNDAGWPSLPGFRPLGSTTNAVAFLRHQHGAKAWTADGQTRDIRCTR